MRKVIRLRKGDKIKEHLERNKEKGILYFIYDRTVNPIYIDSHGTLKEYYNGYFPTKNYSKHIDFSHELGALHFCEIDLHFNGVAFSGVAYYEMGNICRGEALCKDGDIVNHIEWDRNGIAIFYEEKVDDYLVDVAWHPNGKVRTYNEHYKGNRIYSFSLDLNETVTTIYQTVDYKNASQHRPPKLFTIDENIKELNGYTVNNKLCSYYINDHTVNHTFKKMDLSSLEDITIHLANLSIDSIKSICTLPSLTRIDIYDEPQNIKHLTEKIKTVKCFSPNLTIRISPLINEKWITI